MIPGGTRSIHEGEVRHIFGGLKIYIGIFGGKEIRYVFFFEVLELFCLAREIVATLLVSVTH